MAELGGESEDSRERSVYMCVSLALARGGFSGGRGEARAAGGGTGRGAKIFRGIAGFLLCGGIVGLFWIGNGEFSIF